MSDRRPDVRPDDTPEPKGPARETFTQGALTLELLETEGEVRVEWRGRSTERHPEAFLGPVLQRALERGGAGGRPVVLDFTAMEYMNSSTFTPLVRLLERAAREGGGVRLEYAQAKRWQALSFAALKAFETVDGRVSVHGR